MADQNTEVFKAELEADASNFESIIKTLNEVAKSAADAAKGLKLLQGIDLKNLKINLDTGEVKKGVDETKKSLSELRKEAVDLKVSGKPIPPETIKSLSDAKLAASGLNKEIDLLGNKANVGDLVSQFHAVNDVIDITRSSWGDVVRDFSEGFTLAKQGGIQGTLVGVRQALFGLSNETNNGFANALDKGIGFLREFDLKLKAVTSSEEALLQAASRTAEQLSQFNGVLATQVKILKDVSSKETGLSKGAFTGLDAQVQRVSKSFKDMTTVIEGGGKITSHQLNRIRIETTGLETEFQTMVKRGLIPAGSESEKLFNQIVQKAQASRVAIERLAAQQDALGKTGGKRLISAIVSPFNLMGQAATSGVSSLFNLSGQFLKFSSDVSGASSILNVFVGTLLGGLGTNIISGAFNAISGGIASMKGEFFSANDSVQNFRITLANMMKGTGADVQEVTKNVESFIRDVVAKTPFELTTAFESFQRLVIAGFDPKEWLTPVSDAAAALNKPMDQLIGAMARLQSGAKGIGIDMLRDFGIPVQQVGSFVEKSTGRMLNQNEVLNENTDLYKASAEELAAMGVEFKRLEFDKQGSLINDTGDALNILNGFLRQNATYAGAAETRSRSLTGVLSNLKDFFTNLLIVAGQPIFTGLTEGGMKMVQILTLLQPGLERLATSIGTGITNAITFANSYLDSFVNYLNNLPQSVSMLGEAMMALFGGQWQEAWFMFLTVIDTNLNSAIDHLFIFSDEAFNWGANFVSQIATGVIDAASTILVRALSYVGNTIADFLMPGSPPKEGILSTMDEWGKPLSKMFSSDLAEGLDPKPVENALKPLAGVITGQEGPLADQLNKESSIEKKMREIQELRAKLLKAQELGLPSAEAITEQLKKAEGELNTLTQAGNQANTALSGGPGKPTKGPAFPTMSGKGGGGAASTPKGLAPKETLEDKFAREKQALDDRKAAGLISQTEYLNELLKLEKDFVKRSQEEGLTAGLEAHVQAIKDLTKEATVAETNELQARYNSGLIGEEEYTKELLKISEKQAEERLALGQTLTDAEIKNIKDLQAAAESFKGRGSGDAGGLPELIPQAGDILSSFGDLETEIGNAGENIGKAFNTGMGTVLQSGIDTLTASIKDKLSTRITEINDMINDKFLSKITESVKGYSDTINAESESFLSKLKQRWDETWDSIVKSLKANIIGNIYQFLFEALATGGLIANIDKLSEALRNFWNIALTVADKISPRLGLLVLKLEQFFSNMIPGIMNGIRAFTSAISRFIPFLKTFGARIASISSRVAGTVAWWTVLAEGVSANIDLLAAMWDDLVIRFSGTFGRLVELFQGMKERVFDPIVGIIFGFFGSLAGDSQFGLQDLINTVTSFFDAFFETIRLRTKYFFAGIFEIMNAGVKGILLPILDIGIGLWAFLVGDNELGKESFEAAFDNIRSAIPELISGLIDLIATLFVIDFDWDLTGMNKKIFDWLMGLKDSVNKFFEGDLNIADLFNNMGLGALTDIDFSAVIESFFGVKDAVMDVFNILVNLKDSIIQFAEASGVIDAFKSIDLNQIITSLGTLKTSFENAFNAVIALKEPVLTAVNQIKSALEPALNSMKQVFGATFSPQQSPEELSELSGSAMPQSAGFSLPSAESMAPITDSLSKMWEALIKVGEAFGKLGINSENVIGFLQTAATSVATALVAILTIAAGVITGIATGIAAAITTISENITLIAGGVTTVVNGIINQVTGLMAIFTGIITADMPMIVEGFKMIWDGMITMLIGIGDIATGIMIGAIETILDLMSGFYDGMIGYFTNLYDELVGDSIIPDLVNGIIMWISQLKTRAIQFFTDFIDNAIDLFKVEKFTSMGKNAILGILQGLKAAESQVIEYLKKLIEEKIVGGIQSLLDMRSPSLVFAELGVNTMLGFLKGMQESSGTVEAGAQQSAKDVIQGFVKGISQNTVEGNANSVFRSIFFKLGRAFDVHKEILDEKARAGARDWGGKLTDEFNKMGNEMSIEEREKMKDILANISQVRTETLAKNVYDELGVTLDQFVDKYFQDFKAKREEFARENLGMVQTLLDDADKIIDAFNAKLLEQRQTMYIDLDIATALTGQDLTPEKLKEMVDAINQGKSFGADIDSAILSAFNAQEKYNASLEEQKKIQEAQLKLEQQRSRLAFLQQQLQLVQQAKDAGVAGDLLEGLNLGADAATSDVLEQMAKITEAIIKNTQEQLGIKSPSKVFYGFGENLMKGLGQGIKKSFGLVTSSMDKVNSLLTKVPENPQISRLTTNVPSPVQNSRNITYAPTNNIGDKLDAALLLRQQQDAFLGALR